MSIVLDDRENLVADTDTALLEGVLQNPCSILQCPFQERPDSLEQCGCYVETKVDLVPTDPS